VTGLPGPPDRPVEASDELLLCYCTSLTVGELRRAVGAGRWPLPGKERTGKLCTGCLGDLLVCLRWFDAKPVA